MSVLGSLRLPAFKEAASGARGSYRPEIDGLRAIAVLVVMLFHAGVSAFDGGYVGVDIFFVISGFLITSTILEDKDKGQFTLRSFYTRRVRRIFPALAFIVVACTPAAWFLMLPHELKEFSKGVFAVAVFSSNILFWRQSGYFAPDTDLNPLIHTWSLAVEEQYYLLYPLLLIFLWRRTRASITVVLLILMVTSLAFAEHVSDSNQISAFFLTPFRLWELLAGGIAAQLQRRGRGGSWDDGILAGVGLALVIGSIVFVDRDSAVPGLVAAPVIVGTSLILLFARGTNLVGRCLSVPALVGIGLISYSLYLWHQPLLAFARISLLEEPRLVERLAILAGAFPLAYLSWRYVEQPFRDRRRFSSSTIWKGAALVTLIFMIFGFAGYKSWGFYEIKFAGLSAEARERVVDRPREVERRAPIWGPLIHASGRPFEFAVQGGRVLVLGDSKANDMFVATQLMRSRFPGLSVRRLRLDDLCMDEMARLVGTGAEGGASRKCRAEADDVRRSSLLDESDVVMLVAAWQEQSVGGAARLASALRRLGKRVIVVGTANFNDPASLSMGVVTQRMHRAAAERYVWENKQKQAARTAEKLRHILAREPQIEYHSGYDLFCDEADQRCRLYDASGRPLLFDHGHVTVEGARYMAARLSELGWLSSQSERVRGAGDVRGAS